MMLNFKKLDASVCVREKYDEREERGLQCADEKVTKLWPHMDGEEPTYLGFFPPP